MSRYYDQVCVDTLEQECGLVQDVLCRNVTETRSVSVVADKTRDWQYPHTIMLQV